MDWVGVVIWTIAIILFILCIIQWGVNTHL